VKPILSKHGLVLLQPLDYISKDYGDAKISVSLKTIIIDSDSGETITETTVLPENNDPQKMGAIITYFRRYAIQSMLCLQAEDDDGASASQTVKSTLKTVPVNNDLPFGGTEVCKDCGSEMVPGKNGKTYCKPCYIKWVNENKK
jgi:hypothetical protein